MPPLNRIKKIFKAFDFFSHRISFRYDDEPAYESVTGGVCSIIMIVVFIAIFTGTTVNTLNKVYINSSTKNIEDIDPSYYKMGTDTFMFAVGLTGINMNQGEKWFDVYMQFRNYNKIEETRDKTFIPLVQCNRSVWTQINGTLGEVYDRLGFDSWLCPQAGTQLQLQGKYTSQIFKFYKFAVTQCNKQLNPQRGCLGQQVIEQFLDDEQVFNFNFYFVNMVVNPSSHQYLTYYLDDLNYFPFSLKSGVNANLFLSSFNVQTDESIMPWEDIRNETGGIVLNTAQILNYEVRQDEYVKFYLRKSSLSIKVQRSFRRADDTLSYIGGLFSAIVSILLIMSLYDQFSYELEIASNLYHYEKDKPLDSQSFNIIAFFGYLIYLAFDKFNIQLPWKRMAEYHYSLEEVRKQMDVRLIMKKILYSERVTYAVMQEHQAKILHLQEPLTLEEAEQIRKDHRFYQKLANYALNLPSLDQKSSQQKTLHTLKDENFGEDFDRTMYLGTQPSPTKKRKDSDNKIHPQLQEDEKQKNEQFARRLENVGRYIQKLKQGQKQGDCVSKRILERYDHKLINKLLEHYAIRNCLQPQIKQRKLNQFPEQILELSEEDQHHSKIKPDKIGTNNP